MKNLLTYIQKHRIVIMLILSIVLIRLPPFYLLPVQSSLIMSHTLARICIGIVFIYWILTSKKTQPNHILQMLLILWFFSQSISIVSAINMNAFFDVYKDIVFAMMLFYATFYTITHKNIDFVMKGLVTVSGIHIIFQLLVYFFPNLSISAFHDIIHAPYWDVFYYQFSRGRFFGDALDETMIPIIVYLISLRPTLRKGIVFLPVVAGITFISLASSWRSKFILYVLSAFGSLFLLQKKRLPLFIAFAAILTFLLIISSSLSFNLSGSNVVDRFLATNSDETAPIIARVNYWKEAIAMGNSSFLTGVGIGNYFDNLSFSSQSLSESSQLDRYTNVVVIEDPHNIFFSIYATTGLLGLTSFAALFGYFGIRDIRMFAHASVLMKAWITTFWIIFAYSMFNPWAYFGYIAYLLFTRGVVEKLYTLHGK